MHQATRKALAALALVLIAAATAGAQERNAPVWPEGYTTRLEALALLQTLNADLLSNTSATLTLDRWCGVHRLASPARIVAERVQDAEQAPTAEQRQLLGVGPREPVRFRRVRLKCGDHVLSEAENWYVPSRLTPDMNRLLETTDTAFGRAVQPLNFQRRTLSAKLLWSPLPQGWEMGGVEPSKPDGRLNIPHEVLQHRAVLTLPDGTPFSQVVETYTGDVLAFPEPGPATSPEQPR
jgi:chorismate-pyruvate lyase